MPKSHGHDWVGVPEAAAYLGIIQHTLYRMIDKGQLPAYRLGGDRPALGRLRGVHRGLPRSAGRPVPPLPARRPRPPPKASSSTARTPGVSRFPPSTPWGPVSSRPSVRYGALCAPATAQQRSASRALPGGRVAALRRISGDRQALSPPGERPVRDPAGLGYRARASIVGRYGRYGLGLPPAC
jgi:excisionase family DNA binding protein